MSSLLAGLFILGLTVWLSLIGGFSQYFQMHSLSIVGLGSLAILFLTTPTTILKCIFSSFQLIKKREESISDYSDIIRQLVTDKGGLVHTHNPLLKYAQQLWEQGLPSELFIALLSEKRAELESKNIEAIHALKNLAKYPPALGMIGTVMGMIDLFSALDKNQAKIGIALSVTMTSTFLGLIISNIFISPLADRLHLLHLRSNKINTSLYELILLINSEQPYALIDEEIKTRVA